MQGLLDNPDRRVSFYYLNTSIVLLHLPNKWEKSHNLTLWISLYLGPISSGTVFLIGLYLQVTHLEDTSHRLRLGLQMHLSGFITHIDSVYGV